MGLLICFHLDTKFLCIVWNQNQKAAYDIISSYKVYAGWHHNTDSLSLVLDHTLRRWESFYSFMYIN